MGHTDDRDMVALLILNQKNELKSIGRRKGLRWYNLIARVLDDGQLIPLVSGPAKFETEAAAAADGVHRIEQLKAMEFSDAQRVKAQCDVMHMMFDPNRSVV